MGRWKYVQEYVDETSMHGPGEFVSSSRPFRPIWVVIVCCCAGMAGYQIYMVITNFMQSPVITSYETLSAINLTFPQVQVCLSNPIDQRKMDQLGIYPGFVKTIMLYRSDPLMNLPFLDFEIGRILTQIPYDPEIFECPNKTCVAKYYERLYDAELMEQTVIQPFLTAQAKYDYTLHDFRLFFGVSDPDPFATNYKLMKPLLNEYGLLDYGKIWALLSFEIETVFSTCVYGSVGVNCSAIAVKTFDMTNGLCYSVTAPGKGIQNVNGVGLVLSLNSHSEFAQTVFPTLLEGVSLRVDDTYDPTSRRSYRIPYGSAALVSLYLTSFDMQVSEAFGKCRNTMDHEVTKMQYTDTSCRTECVYRSVLKQCGCVVPMPLELLVDPKTPLCGFVGVKCMITKLDFEDPTLTDCLGKCLPKCQYNDYRTTVTYNAYPSEQTQTKLTENWDKQFIVAGSVNLRAMSKDDVERLRALFPIIKKNPFSAASEMVRYVESLSPAARFYEENSCALIKPSILAMADPFKTVCPDSGSRKRKKRQVPNELKLLATFQPSLLTALGISPADILADDISNISDETMALVYAKHGITITSSTTTTPIPGTTTTTTTVPVTSSTSTTSTSTTTTTPTTTSTTTAPTTTSTTTTRTTSTTTTPTTTSTTTTPTTTSSTTTPTTTSTTTSPTTTSTATTSTTSIIPTTTTTTPTLITSSSTTTPIATTKTIQTATGTTSVPSTTSSTATITQNQSTLMSSDQESFVGNSTTEKTSTSTPRTQSTETPSALSTTDSTIPVTASAISIAGTKSITMTPTSSPILSKETTSRPTTVLVTGSGSNSSSISQISTHSNPLTTTSRTTTATAAPTTSTATVGITSSTTNTATPTIITSTTLSISTSSPKTTSTVTAALSTSSVEASGDPFANLAIPDGFDPASLAGMDLGAFDANSIDPSLLTGMNVNSLDPSMLAGLSGNEAPKPESSSTSTQNPLNQEATSVNVQPGVVDASAKMDLSALGGLDPSLLSGMDLGSLDPSMMAGIDPSMMAGIDPSMMAGIGPSMMAGIDPAMMAGIDPSMMAGIDPSMMAGIDPSMLGSLDPSMLSGLPSDVAGQYGDKTNEKSSATSAPNPSAAASSGTGGTNAQATVVTSSSSITYGQQYKKQNVIIEIAYNELQYFKVSQEVAIKWDGFIAQIGGHLGLFLGASIVTIFHFFVFIVEHFYLFTCGRHLTLVEPAGEEENENAHMIKADQHSREMVFNSCADGDVTSPPVVA